MSWGEINEYVLLRIYSLLSTGDLASAGKVCRRWRGISRWAHVSVDIQGHSVRTFSVRGL